MDVIEELDTVLILKENKKGSVVDISNGIYVVEYCDDCLSSGDENKWKLFYCSIEELELIHKGPMRNDE